MIKAGVHQDSDHWQQGEAVQSLAGLGLEKSTEDLGAGGLKASHSASRRSPGACDLTSKREQSSVLYAIWTYRTGDRGRSDQIIKLPLRIGYNQKQVIMFLVRVA